MALVCDVLNRGDDVHVERYVVSQAAAVLIRRLYVLTWIPAWRGVFFLRSLWTSISSPVCHLRGTVYFDPPLCWSIGTIR